VGLLVGTCNVEVGLATTMAPASSAGDKNTIPETPLPVEQLRRHMEGDNNGSEAVPV